MTLIDFNNRQQSTVNNIVTPYDVLTNTDKDKIDIYRTLYGSSHGIVLDSYQKANLSTVLKYWDRAKGQYLFDMFKNQLIIEFPITYEITSDELIDKFNDHFWTAENKKFKELFLQKAFEYIEAMPVISYNHFMFPNNTFNFNMFFYNSTLALNQMSVVDFTEINIIFNQDKAPNQKPLKIYPDTKIMRILGKLSTIMHIEQEFEQFRIAQSLFTNQKIITGTMCLSIHPLDFMTMSDNDCNWDSCMSWKGEGEYRIGTIEMMNSPNVVCAYLKSDTTPFKIDKEHYWANKKWRELFIVTPEVITEIKPYPYVNRYFTEIILNKLKELAENFGWYYEDEATSHNCDSASCYIAQDDNWTNIIFNTQGMYNDFGTTDRHLHLMYLGDNLVQNNPNIYLNINYSGEDNCIWCGMPFYFDDTDRVTCYNCNGAGHYCCCCESWVSEDYVFFDNFGDVYCEDCYNEYYIYDDYADRDILKEDAMTITIINDENVALYRINTTQDSIEYIINYESKYPEFVMVNETYDAAEYYNPRTRYSDFKIPIKYLNAHGKQYFSRFFTVDYLFYTSAKGVETS